MIRGCNVDVLFSDSWEKCKAFNHSAYEDYVHIIVLLIIHFQLSLVPWFMPALEAGTSSP